MKTCPLTKNMKATFGTRLNGYSGILGTMEALHSSSSSVMLCITLGGLIYSSNPIRWLTFGFVSASFTLTVGIFSSKVGDEVEDDDNGDDDNDDGGDEGEEVEMENCVNWRLNENSFIKVVMMIPRVRPHPKRRK